MGKSVETQLNTLRELLLHTQSPPQMKITSQRSTPSVGYNQGAGMATTFDTRNVTIDTRRGSVNLDPDECNILLLSAVAVTAGLILSTVLILCCLGYRNYRRSKLSGGTGDMLPQTGAADDPEREERYAMVEVTPRSRMSEAAISPAESDVEAANCDTNREVPDVMLTSYSNCIYYSTSSSRSETFTNTTFRNSTAPEGGDRSGRKEETVFTELEDSENSHLYSSIDQLRPRSEVMPEKTGCATDAHSPSLSGRSTQPVCPSKGGQLVVPTLPEDHSVNRKLQVSQEKMQTSKNSAEDMPAIVTSSTDMPAVVTSSTDMPAVVTSSKDVPADVMSPKDMPADVMSPKDMPADVMSPKDMPTDA